MAYSTVPFDHITIEWSLCDRHTLHGSVSHRGSTDVKHAVQNYWQGLLIVQFFSGVGKKDISQTGVVDVHLHHVKASRAGSPNQCRQPSFAVVHADLDTHEIVGCVFGDMRDKIQRTHGEEQAGRSAVSCQRDNIGPHLPHQIARTTFDHELAVIDDADAVG